MLKTFNEFLKEHTTPNIATNNLHESVGGTSNKFKKPTGDAEFLYTLIIKSFIQNSNFNISNDLYKEIRNARNIIKKKSGYPEVEISDSTRDLKYTGKMFTDKNDTMVVESILPVKVEDDNGKVEDYAIYVISHLQFKPNGLFVSFEILDSVELIPYTVYKSAPL